MQSLGRTLPIQTSQEKTRSIRILASTLFRELVNHGYSPSHVVSLTSELLELLTDSVRSKAGQAQDRMMTALREELPEADV